MKTTSVDLTTPVKREAGDVARVTLRQPQAGELRGLKLLDVLQMDVNALITLIPRISDPALTQYEVATMDLPEITALGTGVLSFFPTAGVPLPTM